MDGQIYMRLKFIARLLSEHWAEANNLRQIFVIKLIMMYTVDNATIIAANIITRLGDYVIWVGRMEVEKRESKQRYNGGKGSKRTERV